MFIFMLLLFYHTDVEKITFSLPGLSHLSDIMTHSMCFLPIEEGRNCFDESALDILLLFPV